MARILTSDLTPCQGMADGFHEKTLALVLSFRGGGLGEGRVCRRIRLSKNQGPCLGARIKRTMVS